MDIPEGMNVWAGWKNYTTNPAMYESLAEECAELAQAALKMGRLIRNENPTPITRCDAEAKLQEEFTDVIGCAIALNLEVDAKLSCEKFDRMKKRHQNADKCAADVAPVVHGRWLRNENNYYYDYYCTYFDYNCSVCDEVVNDRYGLPDYCPHCGAKMEGWRENNG